MQEHMLEELLEIVNTSLSINELVRDLVNMLEPSEKLSKICSVHITLVERQKNSLLRLSNLIENIKE